MGHAHRHAEAFKVMRYQTADGSESELIWNSRDGVTPFCVTLPSGAEATHVDWNADVYCPDHAEHMKPGDRYFVDLDGEAALMLAEANVEAWWDHPQYPMSKRWATKDAAVRDLAQGYLTPAGSPHLKVWL